MFRFPGERPRTSANVYGIVGPLGLEDRDELVDYARKVIASIYLLPPWLPRAKKLLRFEGEIESPSRASAGLRLASTLSDALCQPLLHLAL
jgi:hypothetical protein